MWWWIKIINKESFLQFSGYGNLFNSSNLLACNNYRGWWKVKYSFIQFHTVSQTALQTDYKVRVTICYSRKLDWRRQSNDRKLDGKEIWQLDNRKGMFYHFMDGWDVHITLDATLLYGTDSNDLLCVAVNWRKTFSGKNWNEKKRTRCRRDVDRKQGCRIYIFISAISRNLDRLLSF